MAFAQTVTAAATLGSDTRKVTASSATAAYSITLAAPGSVGVVDNIYIYVTDLSFGIRLAVNQSSISGQPYYDFDVVNRVVRLSCDGFAYKIYDMGVDDSVLRLDALKYKGAINCSANPNFPAADAGDVYVVSAAGKIGGASGYVVAINATLICNTDGTTAGTKAAKGAYWDIVNQNIEYTAFDSANVDTDSIFSANLDTKVASQKAVKTAFTTANTYADAAALSAQNTAGAYTDTKTLPLVAGTGVTNTFLSADAKTISVVNGVIVSIS